MADKYFYEDGLKILDIGSKLDERTKFPINVHSQINNNMIQPINRAIMPLILTGDFVNNWSYAYKTQPRKFKIHRSYHPHILFCLSVYFPYRYSKQIETAAISLHPISEKFFVNFAKKGITKFVIYAGCMFLGQLIAKTYWAYKRSYCATQSATLNVFLRSKFLSHESGSQ